MPGGLVGDTASVGPGERQKLGPKRTGGSPSSRSWPLRPTSKADGLKAPSCRHLDLPYHSGMARFRIQRTLVVATCFAGLWNGVEGRALAWRQTHEVPPPPPPTYHPTPGPFLAYVDEQGVPEDRGVITNALQQWGGPKLAAFSICFRPNTAPVDWKLSLQALTSVSQELKAQGASVVVIEARRVCTAPLAGPVAGKPRIEISGVIRSVD